MAFEYTPYRNPYIGTIADLMARGEDAKAKALIDVASAQARAAEAKGQIYGNAIQNIGQSASKALSDYTLEKQNAPIRAAEAAHRAALNEQDIFAAGQRQRTIDQQGREDQVRGLIQEISTSRPTQGFRYGPLAKGVAADASTSDDYDPTARTTLASRAVVPTTTPSPYFEEDASGVTMWKIPEVIQAFSQRGLDGAAFANQLSVLNQGAQERHNSSIKQAQNAALNLIGVPADLMPDALEGVIQFFEKNRALPATLLDSMRQQAAAIRQLPLPLQDKAYTTLLRRVGGERVTPDLKQYDPEKDLYDASTASLIRPGVPRAPTPGETETARHNRILEEIATRNAGRAELVAEENARHQKVMEGKGPAVRGVMSSDANRLADFDTSLDDTDVLRTVLGDTGTFARVGASMPTWVTELTGGWGADAKSRNAVIARVKQVIGKALEGGVLRKEDEEKYKDILPTIGDTEAVALSKINGLEAAIVLRKSRLLDSLEDAGYDMQKFRQRLVRVPSQALEAKAEAALKAANRDTSPASIKAFLLANPGFR